MDRLTELKELYAYNRWANNEILDAVAELSDQQFTRDLGSSFASVRDTLVHIMAADWIWLSRWQGVSPTQEPPGWANSGLAELRSEWQELEQQRTAFLDSLDEARLNDVMVYRNKAGTRFETPVWQMLRHVVNHSTYHRGQVTTMLRQLGVRARSTDLILYYRRLESTRPAPAAR
jgi:uncharacterized damage-inducible protein DinB